MYLAHLVLVDIVYSLHNCSLKTLLNLMLPENVI